MKSAFPNKKFQTNAQRQPPFLVHVLIKSKCLSLTRLPVGAFIGNAMQNTENARRFVHLARTSIISSLNPNESSPGRAGKALEKREAERVSGSGWRAAHTRRAGGRVSQSRKGLRSWAG